MTILAGVVSRDPWTAVPDAARHALRLHISRNVDDRRIEFDHPRAYFVKVDIGAFGRPAHRQSPNGSFAMLAGEPLIVAEGLSNERDIHLAYLQAHLDHGNSACLRNAAGTFCAAYFDPRRDTTHLITDRLGLRPLYYAVTDEFIYFASAMRILEAIEQVPKAMNVCAVAEITGFGYPFGGRTPYAGVTMLQPCEIATVRRGEIRSSRYFDWSSIAHARVNEEQALQDIFRLFQSAVRRRVRKDTTTFAYLSGGLDSRCVVAALRERDMRVYTFNFSLANTQDQAFGRDFADKIGAIHEEVPTEPGPDWSSVMAQAWAASVRRRERMPERPQVVWTGEGGSVGLGHVYITPEIVRALREEDVDGAIDTFLRQQKRVLLTRILAPALARRLHGHLHARMRKELEAIGYPDPLRNFYIFLNLNGPRRHLEKHFDTIDRHRLENQVPFYDSELIEYLTSISAEPCLYHRLYTRWLELFPPAVAAVPWQAYPGHVASPIPIPETLPDQWTQPASAAHEARVERELRARSAAMLASADFPHRILRRAPLRLMWWAWRLKAADYAYAMEAALTYYGHWKVTGGMCEMDGSTDGEAAAAMPRTARTSGVLHARDSQIAQTQ
jgi:hypothetical protein